MKVTAGVLVYRETDKGLEVLIVHPSGNYNRHKPYGIPKGELNKGEDLEDAARRELYEETGVICRKLYDLGYCDYQKSGKRVYCFAAKGAKSLRPECTSWEIDDAIFVSIRKAQRLLHPDQKIFVKRLKQWLASK
ncbi:MAG: NUDIX domain-containing protein [Candidatus Obscuribacterales bacterium]|nr:NUDIX domain-containing protein [Candidatus Obscuribacterales bacterium]